MSLIGLVILSQYACTSSNNKEVVEEEVDEIASCHENIPDRFSTSGTKTAEGIEEREEPISHEGMVWIEGENSPGVPQMTEGEEMNCPLIRPK